MSFLPWLALAYMTPSGAFFVYLVVLLTTQCIGVIIANGIIDATVGEVARQKRIDPTKVLRPISWFTVAFGGVIGYICEKIGLAIFNLERFFIFLSLLPIFQLFARRLLGEKALESNDNNNAKKVVSVEVLNEPPIDVDYFGMLNSFIEEEDYLDTILLQTFVKEREFLDDKDGMAPQRLYWTISEGKHAKGPTTPSKTIKQYKYNDADWIQLEKNEIEIFPHILEIDSPNVKENVHRVFDHNTNDTTDKLDFIEMDELEKRIEQPSIGAHLNSEHHESSQVNQVQEKGFLYLWQEYIISNIVNQLQPTIMQLVLWILITQLVTPSLSSIMLCYRLDDLQMESTYLRPSPMITWGGLMLSTFLFNHYFKHIPMQKVKLW